MKSLERYGRSLSLSLIEYRRGTFFPCIIYLVRFVKSLHTRVVAHVNQLCLIELCSKIATQNSQLLNQNSRFANLNSKFAIQNLIQVYLLWKQFERHC